VDGTENPAGPAAAAAVLVGDEDAPFAAGSYLIAQKYLHDMRAWNAVPTEEQERVIGRTKLANIELSDDVKPANSHVALNTITGPDGQQRQIVRDNMPFGSAGRGEFGTYFLGYAATSDVIEQMLTNMFIGSPPGNYDRILDFSAAVTGGLFFAPAADFLDDLPDPPAETAGARELPGAPVPAAGEALAGADEPAGNGPAPDGSLQIGSLNRSARP
jgi:putative iron-dependent peroxidase